MTDKTLKSSEARTGLKKLVGQVVDTGEDLLIEQNGEVVARLTTSEPKGIVKPIHITTVDAREGWAKLLDSVVRGAKWFFVFNRARDTPVYLVRHKTYRNDFFDRWRTHAAMERLKEQSADAPLRKLAWVFRNVRSQRQTLQAIRR